MFGNDAVCRDAFVCTLRDSLELQKRQVELLEAQLEIIGCCVHLRVPRSAMDCSTCSDESANAACDSRPIPRVNLGSRGDTPSKLASVKVAMKELDNAPQQPIFEPRPASELNKQLSQLRTCQSASDATAERSACSALSVPKTVISTPVFVESKVTALLGECNLQCSRSTCKYVSSVSHTDLPRDMPTFARQTFVFIGGAPAERFQQGFRRKLYQAYRYMISLGFLHGGFMCLLDACLQARNGHFPIEVTIGIMGMVLGPSVTTSVRRQLGAHGAYMDKMHQMTRRSFNWEPLERGAYVLWCCVLFAEMFLIFFLVAILRGDMVLSLKESRELPILGPVVQACFVMLCVNGFHCVPVFLCYVWTFWAFAEFHRHDLLSYGALLVKLVEDDEDTDPIGVINRLERNIAASLEYASRTWVRVVMLSTCAMILLSLLAGSYLVSATDFRGMIIASFVLLTSFGFITCTSFAVARVAETFEDDVLRSLNNPVLLKNAQQHFGQQLLPHLQRLEWGFRFGGTIINVKLVSHILAGLSASICVAVSQSFFALVNNAL